MRRALFIAFLVLSVWTSLPATKAHAQYGGGGPGGRGGQGAGGDDEDADKKKKQDEEWSTGQNLDVGKKNAGPCPFVKILYDAARYQQFKNDRVASDAVEFTGEIERLSSGCQYAGTDPIRVATSILFEFGRGPAAESMTKDFSYWVAVTDRNREVIDKQYFTIHAVFQPGQNRLVVTEPVYGLKIPRADTNVSGANFEVLVGFDVTPAMVDFNRQGKRFRANAGPAVASQ